MPDYGGYQIRRPHAPGAWASVYEAVAPDGVSRVALKIFHPPPSTNLKRFLALEGWLLAAEKQQQAARAAGGNGAVGATDVLAFGRCAEGVFAVYPWHDAPLEPRLELLSAKGDLLRALAESLLRALEGWEKSFGGPHGNLRATNVFLADSAVWAGAKLRLSDPWFLPGALPESLRARDFAAVGAMLAQVVRRRAPGGWPIEDAPEWRKLGRAGNAWREYCNFLLDPNGDPAVRTLDEARRRLQHIPRDAKPGRRLVLATAGVVVLAAAGVTAFARFGDPQGMPRNLRRLAEITGNPRAFRTEVVPEWALLCRAWNTWLGDLERQSPRWQRTGALWSANDPLRAALVQFSAEAVELRPGTIVPEAAKENRLGLLADSPPDAVRRQLLRGTIAERVTEAWAQIDGVAKQLETWPRWSELRELNAQLEARGFQRTSAALQARVPVPPADAVVRPDPAVLLKTINDVSLDDTGSLLLVQRWGDIARVSAEMAASGDRVQAALPALTLASLRDRASLGDFVDSLAPPLEELRRRRAQFLDPAVVRERFLQESATQQPAGAPVTEEDLPRWEAQLAAFTLVPAAEDPRATVGFDDRNEELLAAAADLEAEAPAGDAAGGAPLSRADFDREFARLKEQASAVRTRPTIRRDVPALRAELDQLAGTYAGFAQRLDGTVALLRPERWIQKVVTQTWAFPALQARWDAWRQAALANVVPAQLQSDRDRFRQLRQQERTLRVWLDEVVGARAFGGLAVPENLGAPETAEALVALEKLQRAEAVAATTDAAEWRNQLPTTPWLDAGERVRGPLENHRRWLADLPAAAAELERLASLLRDGYGWTEGVETTHAAVTRRDGMARVGGAPAASLGQARRLGELAASNDRTALVGAVQSEGLSVPLTAWRRLGAIDGWPSDANELDVEGALVATLRTRIDAGGVGEERKQTLQSELSQATRLRWNRAARNAARDAAALIAVFERMDRYSIAESDLEAPVAYNLALFRFKNADRTETRLGPWRDRRDEFVAQARALGAGLGARATEQDFLRALEALPLIEDAAQQAAVTPSRAGWTEELTGEGERVIAVSRDGVVRLEYQLVKPADGTPPFFLATQALSVGHFVHLVNTSGDIGRAVIDALPEWARKETPNKPWNRLTSWQANPDYTGLQVSPSWFAQLNAQMQPMLDAGAEQRVQASVLDAAIAEHPTPESPVQQLPPEAARLFVERLLGARLAAPAEWRAVHAWIANAPPVATNVAAPGNSPGGDTASAAAAKPNLRDRDFQALWDFVAQYDQGGVRVSWRPNEGIFLPRVEVAGGTGSSRRVMPDDGRVPDAEADGKLWLARVDQGPQTAGFIHLFGNVWTYLYDPATKQFHVAGSSALAPRSLDGREPLRVEASGLIGARRQTEGYADVGVRPAFDAPPGFRARFELLRLVRTQPFLTL